MLYENRKICRVGVFVFLILFLMIGVVSLVSATGSLYVASFPSGAYIYLDGVLKGSTNRTLTNVSMGAHSIKLTKPYYYDYFTNVTVNDGQTTYVNADLVIIPKGNIYVSSSPTGAYIYVDNYYKGTTNRLLTSVPIGDHVIKLYKSGYYNYYANVTVNQGQTSYVNADLVIIPVGNLYVGSTPAGAYVYMDGYYKGTTNRTVTNLALGNHSITLTKSGYYNYYTSAVVNQGQTSYVNVVLQNIELVGVCNVRDQYTGLPSLYAPDVGQGYAKVQMPNATDITTLRQKCTDIVYNDLMNSYCQMNSNSAQWQVTLYTSQGNYYQTGCDDSGCGYHDCTTVTTTSTSTTSTTVLITNQTNQII